MPVLENILESTRARVALLKEGPVLNPPKAARSLADSILSKKASGVRAIISEIKFASPSKGRISQPADVNGIAQKMFAAGACGISVLTEPRFFSGDLDFLTRINVPLPLLRKDFIIDESQLAESRHYGADSVLLIARILGENLENFISRSRSFGMEPLVEVHTQQELESVLGTTATLIGINNRDLDTLKVDLDTTRKLSKLIPEEKIVVCESGIEHVEDIEKLEKYADAFLIGTSLMGQNNMEKTLDAFVGGMDA